MILSALILSIFAVGAPLRGCPQTLSSPSSETSSKSPTESGGLMVRGQSLSEEGWAPVETKRIQVEPTLEIDPALWVLFVKSVGEEKFIAHFPGIPTYSYNEKGELEMWAEKGGESFQLTVLTEGKEAAAPHFFEGKWVWEKVIRTPHHVYWFKVTSDRPQTPSVSRFFSSLHIEKNS